MISLEDIRHDSRDLVDVDPAIVRVLTLIAESASDIVEADPDAWRGSELKARIDQLRDLGVAP